MLRSALPRTRLGWSIVAGFLLVLAFQVASAGRCFTFDATAPNANGTSSVPEVIFFLGCSVSWFLVPFLLVVLPLDLGTRFTWQETWMQPSWSIEFTGVALTLLLSGLVLTRVAEVLLDRERSRVGRWVAGIALLIGPIFGAIQFYLVFLIGD